MKQTHEELIRKISANAKKLEKEFEASGSVDIYALAAIEVSAEKLTRSLTTRTPQ